MNKEEFWVFINQFVKYFKIQNICHQEGHKPPAKKPAQKPASKKQPTKKVEVPT